MSSVATLPDRVRWVRSPEPVRRQSDASRARSFALAAAVGGWTALIVAAIWWGPSLLTDNALVGAPPFMGTWMWEVSPAVVAPLALAAATVAYGPRLAATLPWRALVAGAGVVTTGWALALAAVDGWRRVSYPMSTRHEYLAAVEQIESPGSFLRTFTERFDSYPIHVQGHPPGMPLVLWCLDQVGLATRGWAAALVLAGAGVATAATLVAVRSVAGERVARRAAPFVAVGPAAVWLGTSTDAFFSGVIALGIALLVSDRAGPTDDESDDNGTGHDSDRSPGRVGRWTLASPNPRLHLAGGAVLGLALFLSYGAVPLLLIPAGVWLYRRNLGALLWAAAGAALVTLAFWASGFWWFDGLEATRHAYETGTAAYRPYEVFVPLLNPAAFAAATGPALAAGLVLWMGRRRTLDVTVWLLPALALVAVLAADLSGLSKAEVERIWLPFVPWVLVVTALLPRPRRWLAAQVTVALLLQLSLHSPW